MSHLVASAASIPSQGWDSAARADAVIGLAGGRAGACVAVWRGPGLAGVCEVERTSRVRQAGLRPGCLPLDALSLAGLRPEDRRLSYVVAEPDILLPGHITSIRLDRRATHAFTAFVTSGFTSAAVLVCDASADPNVSIWYGTAGAVSEVRWAASADAVPNLYRECLEAFGYPAGQHRRFEALARVGKVTTDRFDRLWRYQDGGVKAVEGWRARVAEWVAAAGASVDRLAVLARSAQESLGRLLLELLAAVRAALPAEDLCLTGDLFFNTYFTTRLATSGCFARTFVPINPGVGGLAVGAALSVGSRHHASGSGISPFLGPCYSPEEIKGSLDNCKLVYDCVAEHEAIDRAVDTLRKGRLVGWFQDRMEWGPRALGARSILADPRAPHVLQNLNVFLKRREPYSAYGMAVAEESLDRFFDGPPSSPYMQFEYVVRDPHLLRPALPEQVTAVRVQSVGREPRLFRRLLEAFEAATGCGVLINTSFSAFEDPIVCSPRDAVRVFFGTGLDLLVLDRFILEK